jgi:hypothetical protein
METLDRTDEPFTLQNEVPPEKLEPLFEPLPKGRQGLLLRGLGDCPGQLDLWDGGHVA